MSIKGNGCDSVGRAVASDSRGPLFESSHWQNLYWMFTANSTEKTKSKKKEADKCYYQFIDKIVHHLNWRSTHYCPFSPFDKINFLPKTIELEAPLIPNLRRTLNSIESFEVIENNFFLIDFESNESDWAPKWLSSFSFFKKLGNPRPLSRLFSVFFEQKLQFWQQTMWKKLSI